MLSALILTEHSYPALPLVRQLAHQRFVRFGPLVLEATLLKFLTSTADRDRQFVTLLTTSVSENLAQWRPAVSGSHSSTDEWRGLHIAMQFGLYLSPSKLVRKVFGV